jgi:hypothetical protein
VRCAPPLPLSLLLTLLFHSQPSLLGCTPSSLSPPPRSTRLTIFLQSLLTEQTKNVEWYDPGNVYTEDGFLVLEVTEEELATSHGFGCTCSFPSPPAAVFFSQSMLTTVSEQTSVECSRRGIRRVS